MTSERTFRKQQFAHTRMIASGIAVCVGIFLVIFTGYWLHWTWTGFNASVGPNVLQYQPTKTLWDWMQLLIVPLVLALGAFLFNITTSRNEQKIALQRDQTAHEIALDNQREILLQAYLDRMSELLLQQHLRHSEAHAEVRYLARARTLTILPRLDGSRKGSLVKFLYESNLIEVINLSGADLSGAILNEAKLHRANLSEANLSQALLELADLSEANLSGANLSQALLLFANLSEANLNGAKLHKADAHDANLGKANLNWADLSEATLNRADMHEASLHKSNLRQAHMQNVNLCNAELRAADLSQADLGAADLTGADLSEAELRGAMLHETILREVNLHGASLTPDQRSQIINQRER